jgi:hypothetical protein
VSGWQVVRTTLIALGFIASIGTTASCQEVIASVEPTEATIRLSDTIILTLVVDGPAPLRVDLPRRLLDDSSARVWQLHAQGAGTIIDLASGRQRWSRTYVATPFIPGKRLPLVFAPVAVTAATAVKAQEIPVPPVYVTVTTQITRLDPEEIRPITPPLPSPESTTNPDWRLLGLIVVVTLVATMFLLRQLYRRNKFQRVDSRQRFLEELDSLSRQQIPASIAASKLFHYFHRYLESRLNIPATRRTSVELAKAEEILGLHPALRDLILECLHREDQLRFSGEFILPEEVESLRTQMLQIVDFLCAENG